jgi:hypothetical protein
MGWRQATRLKSYLKGRGWHQGEEGGGANNVPGIGGGGGKRAPEGVNSSIKYLMRYI